MGKTNFKSKVMVIGAGNVGATVAYTLILENLASEIVLVDVNKQKAKAEVLDMNHGIANFKQVKVREGDYSDCPDCDLIIISAGIARKPGQTRLDLAKINVGIARDIAQNIMKYASNPMILVISNPVDVITYVVQKETGLPASRVFGSGTALDTARLRYLLSRDCNIDVRNVHAYIIGEHGDSQVPVWSCANVGGTPLDEFCADSRNGCARIDREKIIQETKDSGAQVIANKGATYYGIAMAVSRIVGAIFGNEGSVMTVTSVLNNEYGISGVSLSLPCVINGKGIDRVMSLKISEKEKELLHESAEKIKEVIQGVGSKE